MSKAERAFCCGALWRTSARTIVGSLPTDRLGDEVLEIGSGSGAIAAELSRAHPGLAITATDLDPVMVDAATDSYSAVRPRDAIQHMNHYAAFVTPRDGLDSARSVPAGSSALG
jgi:16S rRNA G1207 methylase RsmC